ncbi:MAG: ornithine carbamoyltransferase [Chloroflexi bacterium]|nr:ornithine carbamoyltransferase [Chloroflexota bacterium]
MLATEQKRKLLKGKDLITTADWTKEELDVALELAHEMKAQRFTHPYSECLKLKTFLMFFYNPSVRTRQSFECASNELSGSAMFLEPKAMRLKTATSAGETVEDAARVMSRYGVGIGLRILEDKIASYGEGDDLLREYAQYSDVPIISMAHDKYHPCQGLADMMGMQEHMGDVKGKTCLVYWGHGALARSWCSVQEALLLYPRYGMNIVLAHPEGYDLDPEVVEKSREFCKQTGATFTETNDPVECYKNVDIVYSRNWMSPQAYYGGELHKQEEIEKSLKYPQWICDEDKMKLTRNGKGLFIHPMPVDRGHEVSDEVCSGPRSIIVDVAENRLHAQKSVMALTMGDI